MVGIGGRELGMKECRLLSPEQRCSLIIRTTGELQSLNERADCQHIAGLLEHFTGWKGGVWLWRMPPTGLLFPEKLEPILKLVY